MSPLCWSNLSAGFGIHQIAHRVDLKRICLLGKKYFELHGRLSNVSDYKTADCISANENRYTAQHSAVLFYG